MDDNFDYSPIRRSERLMTIRARVIDDKKDKLPGAIFNNNFTNIQKMTATGNTVKKGFAYLSSDTGRFVCGSHKKNCQCRNSIKMDTLKRRQNQQESSKCIINDAMFNYY